MRAEQIKPLTDRDRSIKLFYTAAAYTEQIILKEHTILGVGKFRFSCMLYYFEVRLYACNQIAFLTFLCTNIG